MSDFFSGGADRSRPIPPVDQPTRLEALVEAVQGRTAVQPRIGIVLGSGLGSLAYEVENPVVIPFDQLPGWPAATAPGHEGRLLIGRLAGIQVDQLKIAVYAISGMLACTAGVLYTAQYRQGKPDAGAGAELDAIAAVVIGGTNLMGGRGSMTGTLVGVLIFGFLGNILQLRNIDSNTQLVLKGGIILAAVLLQEGQLGVRWKQFRSYFRTSDSNRKLGAKPSQIEEARK